MATVETPGVLGTFHGADEFPVEWQEGEQELFWIYDDLHSPTRSRRCSSTSAAGG